MAFIFETAPEMVFVFEYWALEFGIKMNDTDRAYISDVILKDKYYNLVLCAFLRERHDCDLTKLERAYAKMNVIVFWEKFYNDIRCPQCVRLVLFGCIGLYRDAVNEWFPNLFEDRYRYVERWFETAI